MSRQMLRTRWTRRAATLGAIGAVGALALVAMPTAATADTGHAHDDVSGLDVTFACSTMDSTTVTIGFHVDAYAATPDDGRVVKVQAHLDDVPLENWHADIVPPAGYDFFATDDYSYDHVDLGRSIEEGDIADVTFLNSAGAVVASTSATVACFGADSGTTVGDFAVTARLGVPKVVRLLEHVTYDAPDSDQVAKTRVTTTDATWAAGWRGQGADDDLVLADATRAALGASLSDSVLTLVPTAVGDYTLRWGVVTAPEAYAWTGGSGDEWGPGTVTVHVIERPAPPTDAMIVPSSRGPVVSSPSATVGGTMTVSVGSAYQGQYVDVWLHSDPVYLGLLPVRADGTVNVPVPASVPSGTHRVIVADEVGALVGWDDVAIAAADPAAGAAAPGSTNAVPRGATGLDEGTTTPPWWPAALAAAVVVGGAGTALRKLAAKRAA